MRTADVDFLSSEAAPSRARVIAAWATTGVFAAMMTLSGALLLVGVRAVTEGMVQLGYPHYFLRLLGLAKLLGVVGLLAPRRPTLREWTYAGFTFDLLAGIVSHVATGSASHAGGAVFALGLLAGSYLLRRQLPGNARRSPSSGASLA
jgi:hypothetical protein